MSVSGMETLEQIIAEKNKEIADLKSQLKLATEFCDSPCGHSSMWAYSEDGGKHIVCLLCIKARKEVLERENEMLAQNLKDAHDAVILERFKKTRP